MMPRAYIVYFKYKIPSEKAQGPVRQFRIYAASLEEARRMLDQRPRDGAPPNRRPNADQPRRPDGDRK